MTEYAPGVPMWVDVSSPDMDATRAFYGGLFGWDAQVVPGEDAGGYTMFLLNGKMVAAAGPIFTPDQHPAWATYVCSADANATAQAVKDAGGKVLMGPIDVMGQGTMAVCTDTTGAHVSIWQPEIHRGAELVNAIGSFCWNELYTRDMPASREFYQKVFGWGVHEGSFDGGTYTEFQVDGKTIAGGLDMTGMLPESIPPHWLVYFVVANTADSVAKARELGATIMQDTKDTPMGPIAVMTDPGGAAFAIIQTGSPS